MTLASQAYVFDPRPDYPLRSTAKRYWKPSSRAASDPAALTLVFAHATGFHKELFEPLIERLLDLSDAPGRAAIREAWAIDAPNHGDAAVLNEQVLQWGYQPSCAYSGSRAHVQT